VTLDGVRKIYEEKGAAQVAVHRIDLTIEEGEFLVLVGPSGCGKSTTLRMVAGLEEVTEGTIRIGDRVVNEVPARDRDIAMVFQNYALYPHMTVYDNLAFALKLRKTPPAQLDAMVRDAAGLLDIGGLLDRKPRQLSGGQRQRVALGRAIVRQPKVFLFDEPLSNLDAKLRTQTRRELAALRRRLGTTTIYVTHDQVEAMTLGDRIVVMHEGRVQQAGGPLEVYDRPANLFVAGFLGSPAMNLLRGTITRDGTPQFRSDAGLVFDLPAGEGPAVDAGAAVVLGVRPEAIVPGEGSPTFDALIEEVEPLGHEALITVSAAGASITLRVAVGVGFHPGQPLRCSVVPSALHWFDATSGDRLGA
jgi:multiple sugar transport system ATP-binding protein